MRGQIVRFVDRALEYLNPRYPMAKFFRLSHPLTSISITLPRSKKPNPSPQNAIDPPPWSFDAGRQPQQQPCLNLIEPRMILLLLPLLLLLLHPLVATGKEYPHSAALDVLLVKNRNERVVMEMAQFALLAIRCSAARKVLRGFDIEFARMSSKYFFECKISSLHQNHVYAYMTNNDCMHYSHVYIPNSFYTPKISSLSSH